MPDDCLFCRIAAGKIPAKVVFSNASIVAFRDVNPQAPTHLLVIPRKHIDTLNDLGPEEVPLVGAMVQVAADLARQEGLADAGWRLVANCKEGAGQSVFHVHLHVLGGRRFAWPPG